jgi:hypothetical protein
MCGRGIDQVLAHPCSAEIYEAYMRSAESYVLLAERANGQPTSCNAEILAADSVPTAYEPRTQAKAFARLWG